MKKLLGKFVLACAVLFPVLGVLATPARALNLDQAMMALLDRTNVSDIAFSAKSKCMNIQYVGTSTEAVATITQTAMTMYEPYNTLATDFGSASGAYTLSNAAYDTAGELCDAIQALANFNCFLRACKRDDNTTLLLDQTETSGTNNFGAAGGADIQIDAGGSTGLPGDGNFIGLGITPSTGRRVNLQQCKQKSVGTGTLDVYGQLRKFENANDGVTRDDTTKVWTEPTANGTALTETWAIAGVGGGIEFAKGAHVVIRAGDASSAQIAADFLSCNWEEK